MRSRLRRLVDAMFAALVPLIVSPVLTIAILAILIEDGRPVFFAQRRAGRFDRLFNYVEAANHARGRMRRPSLATLGSGSAGYTRWPDFAALLHRRIASAVQRRSRRYGARRARPEMPFIVNGYERWQHLRHLVRPGVTGLWQVELRSTVPLARPEATALDLEHIRTASPRLDGVLIARTFLALVRPKGAF